jgi:hypothetical protein
MTFTAMPKSMSPSDVVVNGIIGPGHDVGIDGRYEAMRSLIWAAAGPNGQVHTNRLINALLPSWELLSTTDLQAVESRREQMREALAALRDAGDILEQGGGYWSPATSRIVRLPDRRGYLLIGGVPSAVLPITPTAIAQHGPHRHLENIPKDFEGLLPVEELSSWARLPNGRLSDWHRELLTSLERQPYSPAETEAFEFYLPDAAPMGCPQFKRWSTSIGKLSGTFLARRTRIYGAREFRLVDARGGRIVGARELCDIDVRRLMYAIDAASGNSVRAYRTTGTDKEEFRLNSELPRPEQRILAAIGVLQIPPDRPYERRWTFCSEDQIALELLASLGIELREVTGGRKR